MDLITAVQFAEALGVSRKSVNAWVRLGRLVPALKPNPWMHLFDRRDVEKFRVRRKPGPRPKKSGKISGISACN